MPVDEAAQVRRVEDIERALRELGPSVAASFAGTVQALKDNIAATNQLVDDLSAQVAAAIAANSYTASTIDQKIANPGDVASSGNISAAGNVTAAGRVYSQFSLQSPGSYGLQVGGQNYVAAWLQSDGQLGFSPSSVTTKTDLAEMTDPAPILGITPYWGRYKWDDPDSPLKAFVLAEDVAAAGFGPDVAPTDEDGKAFTVNYSQLVVPLLAVVRAQQKRLDDAGL